jgi:hypothetical protein
MPNPVGATISISDEYAARALGLAAADDRRVMHPFDLPDYETSHRFAAANQKEEVGRSASPRHGR